jgi:hypothetical protein
MDTRVNHATGIYSPIIKATVDAIVIEAYIKERNFAGIRLLCAHGAILPAQSIVNQFYTLPHSNEWIDLLIENKADLDLINPNTGDTALLFADYLDDSARILKLLESGAKASTKDKKGESFFKYAKNITLLNTMLSAGGIPDDATKIFNEVIQYFRGDVHISILYAGLSALMPLINFANKKTQNDCQEQIYEHDGILSEVIANQLAETAPCFSKDVSCIVKEYLFFLKPHKDKLPEEYVYELKSNKHV